MIADYNVTGSERKRLVNTIGQVLDAQVKYLGMPTAAYEVGEYTISKTGVLTGPDNRELIDALAEPHGFVALVSEYESDPADDATDAASAFDEAGFGQESDRLTIEIPLDGFTPERLDNLCKMVQSKEPLLRKALGAEELPIQVLKDRIVFPWFKNDGNIDAYAAFIIALCKTTKEKKRVTAKARESFENEKFAMRVWLIGLGLVGKEYASARKLLLANLSGNSSWRYGQRTAAPNAAPVHTADESPADNMKEAPGDEISE